MSIVLLNRRFPSLVTGEIGNLMLRLSEYLVGYMPFYVVDPDRFFLGLQPHVIATGECGCYKLFSLQCAPAVNFVVKCLIARCLAFRLLALVILGFRFPISSILSPHAHQSPPDLTSPLPEDPRPEFGDGESEEDATPIRSLLRHRHVSKRVN